jgi:hypothetical protein
VYNPNLKLTELFKSNSLRNMTTVGNNPMPHSGDTYYITYYSNTSSDEPSLIKEILEKGNKWGYGKGSTSISSYVDLTDQAGDLVSSRHIMYGPGSNSSSFHIYVNEYADRVLVTACGWGFSATELYDGDKKYFLQYLLDHQKRGENE